MKTVNFISFIICVLVTSNSKIILASEQLNQIIVEADNSIEYFEKQKVYVASGNAKASKNNFFIKADKIKAFMSKINNTNITNIEATGNVLIKNYDSLAKAGSAKYNFEKKLIVLRGDSQLIQSKKFKIFSNKSIIFDDINKVAKGKGKVKLHLKGNVTISSDKMNANFSKLTNVLINANASGKVKINTNLETITCNSAKYKSKTGLITLSGNIVIKKNNNVLTGEKGYMNLKNRKSRIESSKSKRVKGVFTPSK